MGRSLKVACWALFAVLVHPESYFGSTEGKSYNLDDVGLFKPAHEGGQLDPDDATYVLPPTVEAKRRIIWYPGNRLEDSLHSFELVYPELCSVNATVRVPSTCLDSSDGECSKKNKAPGYGSKKVALVLRGDSVSATPIHTFSCFLKTHVHYLFVHSTVVCLTGGTYSTL